jgi:hypothetical protein
MDPLFRLYLSVKDFCNEWADSVKVCTTRLCPSGAPAQAAVGVPGFG